MPLAITSLAQQLEQTQFALGMAICAVIILACGWMLEEKVEDHLTRRKADTPFCPLHRSDPSVCKPYHKDKE